MSEMSFLFLSLDLDTGKVGIGGTEGASAPDRKQVRDVPMFLCESGCVYVCECWALSIYFYYKFCRYFFNK